MDSLPARLIALYLPQFHPIPENDAWWGKGFTEWTNAAKARPLFPGHYQPHLPADLGFYDLRVPETRRAQADMGREYGIEAFCYYHYWFGDGRTILERPFAEVLRSGEPDFPFCLCWANQSWTGIWHGAPDRILVDQTYPGEADHIAHFQALLPAFRDPRYLTVEGKPLFAIFSPNELPQAREVYALWRRLAREAGLPGLYLVGFHFERSWTVADRGLDAGLAALMPQLREDRPAGMPTVYRYENVGKHLLGPPASIPCVIPNWDNTPRSGANGMVFHESSPEHFERWLAKAIAQVQHKPAPERFVFLKSWNEWAEGNHLEPDQRFGRGYLEAVRRALGVTAARAGP